MLKAMRWIGGFAGLIFFVIIDIGLSYVLPYPWSKINLLFALLIILMLWRGSGWIVWVAFFTHLIIELYTASPFGVVLASSTLSILVSFWLYKHLFTNRSWYAAIALAAITLALFRSLYTAALLILRAFSVVKIIPWKLMLVTFAWEALLTISAVGIIYFIVSRFSTRFKSAVITARRFSI